MLRPDGLWSLANAVRPTGAGLLSDFVAIDVETTGLQPLRQRVIEIALVRYTNGEVADRFATLVNPDRTDSEVHHKTHWYRCGPACRRSEVRGNRRAGRDVPGGRAAGRPQRRFRHQLHQCRAIARRLGGSWSTSGSMSWGWQPVSFPDYAGRVSTRSPVIWESRLAKIHRAEVDAELAGNGCACTSPHAPTTSESTASIGCVRSADRLRRRSATARAEAVPTSIGRSSRRFQSVPVST